MDKIQNLAEQFDRQQQTICCSALGPSENSIEKIESLLKFKLPRSLIEFAKHSILYGNWLASLGEDYESCTHIININNQWHNEPDFEKRLPANLIIFNVGYDEDFDCFDIDTYDEEKDEYLITYWYPGIDLRESNLHDSVYSCLAAQIRGWDYT